MAILDFAVLPFVRTDAVLPVGALSLWPNEPKEWLVRFGCTPPSLLDLYRDRNGGTSGTALSILSRTQGEPVAISEYQDAVVVLSTAEWISSSSGTASDHWIFEPWRIDNAEDSHVRVSKFSMNLTDSDHDRLYPDPYTRSTRLNAYASGEAIGKLSPLLTRADDHCTARLTALWHLYVARRDAPYFGSIFEDLEAIWSAFEAWFRLPRSTGWNDNSTLAQLLRTWVPRALVQKWRKSALESRSRSAAVYDGVRQSLEKIMDVRVQRSMQSFLDLLYSLRNEQAHGGAPALSRLRREEEDAHVMGLALSVWRTIIEYDLMGENIFVARDLGVRLRDTFLERDIYDRLLQAFTNTDRCDWCEDTGAPRRPDLVASSRPLIEEAIDIVLIPRRYSQTAPARNARRTSLLVLSAWVKAATAKGEGVAQEKALAGLHGEMGQIAKAAQAAHGKDAALTKEKTDAGMVKMLIRRELHDPESYSDEALKVLGTLEGISFPQWVRLTVRFHELAVGYALL